MATSRKIATTAALGSGAVATSIFGLLFSESALARRTIGTTDDRPPSADGMYGDADHLGGATGEPISCLILGDSAAVGYGMTRANATPPGMVGLGLAHLLDCPVQITSVAVVGAQTSDLDAQIDLGLRAKPDVALIVIGTNDVIHRVLPGESARRLTAAVRRLSESGCEVVVGTCPDLGTVQPLPQPLRSVARTWSRRLAAKQAMAALEGGGRAVSLGGLLGPVFASSADVMFGEDRFHPSETGYAHMVSVVIPSLAAAIRDKNVDAAYAIDTAVSEPPRDMLPVAEAATKAAQHAGTELVQTGRWATLRRRRRNYDTASKVVA
ncbi:MAG: SGNH/GDSL hydrolase family protein [Actinomycetota bacterium]|nr:SGNH/GDSL hydrolase family protein [Actinomycetota bacterium]